MKNKVDSGFRIQGSGSGPRVALGSRLTTRYSLLLFFLLIAGSLSAQQSLSDFLQQVDRSNPELKALRAKTDAAKVSAKTRLTPNDPELEYEYMPGKTHEAGTRTTLRVRQQIDFPTVYFNKSKLAVIQENSLEQEFRVSRRQILLDAARLYNRQVYLSKIILLTEMQATRTSALLDAWQKKMVQGDATALDLQKVKLEAISTKNELRLAQEEQNRNLELLRVICPDKSLDFQYVDYIAYEIPDDSLVARYLESDPELARANAETELSRQELNVARSEKLPGFSFSYGYEETPGQHYTGPGVGLRLPLWQNHNRIRASKAALAFSEEKQTELRLKRRVEIQGKFNQAKTLKASANEIQQALTETDSSGLLGTALDAGEISLIDYFTELNFFHKLQTQFLGLELEYQQVMTELDSVNW